MVKDKNAPKRALSAYFLWSGEVRASVKKANPTWGIGELGKHLGAEWGKLSDGEKKPYFDRSAKAKVAYNKEMEAYKKTDQYKAHQEAEKSDHSAIVKKVCKKYGIKPKGKKFPKDINKPKKGLSAYLCFGNDMRASVQKNNPGASMTQVSQLMAKQWKETSEAQLAKYKKQAAESKKTQDALIAKYEKTDQAKNYKAARAEFNRLKKKKMKKDLAE